VLPETERFLRELHRLLVPGGQLVIQIWDVPRACRMISLGAAILGRRIPSLQLRSGQTGPFTYTLERLAADLALAGFSLEGAAWHAVEVRAGTPEDYWRKFASLAGTAHAALVEQPAPVRAEIDAELLARGRPLHDGDGALVLPLRWAVCRARKQVSAASING
jgi:hypothetical protein